MAGSTASFARLRSSRAISFRIRRRTNGAACAVSRKLSRATSLSGRSPRCRTCFPILHSASCRFRIPLTYPDTVTVGARIGEIGEDRFEMPYRAVSHHHGAVAAEGESLIVTFSYETGTKAPVSDALKAQLLELRGA